MGMVNTNYSTSEDKVQFIKVTKYIKWDQHDFRNREENLVN